MEQRLHAGAVVLRFLAFFAFHSHLRLVGAFPEMVGVIDRRRLTALRTLETISFAVTARAMIRRDVFCYVVFHITK